MTYEDEIDFINHIKSKGNILLIYNNFKVGDNMILDELPKVNASIYSDYLSLLRPIDFNKIHYTLVESISIYHVHTDKSSIVEFERCKIVNGKMTTGRFWFDTSPEKGEDFIKWANSLLRYVRNNLLKQDGKYFGKAAYELFQKIELGS